MIIVKLMGGLGNQMFQYAFGRSLAIQTNAQLKLDTSYLLDRSPNPDHTFRDYDLDIFNVAESFLAQEEAKTYELSGNLLNKLYKFKELESKKKHYLTEKTILLHYNLSRLSGDIYIDGYWQSEKYFQNIKDIIRQDFTFKNPLDNVAKNTAQEISAVNAISLNIRRGDYLDHQKFLYLCPKEYYIKAMKTIADSTSNPVFFIFSDEIEWCRTNLPLTKYPIKIISTELAGIKFQSYLKLMTLCKHHIISNSTFAWWGAWLNPSKEKIVISPRKWIRNPLYFWHNKNINPDSWIKM